MTVIEPVRHTITVPVDVDTAFRVFVEDMGDWWPREHHIGPEPRATTRIEQSVGGEVVEVGPDGSECRMGTVLAWEPPVRLVVAWQITPQFTPEPDLARSSEYEVRFTAVDERTTTVDLEHRNFERHGEGGEGLRGAVVGPEGWPYVLHGYASHVGAAATA